MLETPLSLLPADGPAESPPTPRHPPPAPSGPRRAREKASERLRAGSAVDECLFLVPKVCGRFLAPLPRPQRISVTSAPAGPALAALLVFAGWDEGKKPNPCANRSESIALAAHRGEGAGCPACSPSQTSPGAGVVPRVPPSSPSCPRSAGLASRALLRGHRSQGGLCSASSAGAARRWDAGSPRGDAGGSITGRLLLAELALGFRFPCLVAQGGFVVFLSEKRKSGVVRA